MIPQAFCHYQVTVRRHLCGQSYSRSGRYEKKNQPRRGEGRQMNNDYTRFLLLALEAAEPMPCLFFIFSPEFPSFPPCLWLVPVKSDIPLCPSKNNQHSATGCQGFHRLTTGVHAEVIRSCQMWRVLCNDWECALCLPALRHSLGYSVGVLMASLSTGIIK